MKFKILDELKRRADNEVIKCSSLLMGGKIGLANGISDS